jgi:hypothetical protein
MTIEYEVESFFVMFMIFVRILMITEIRVFRVSNPFSVVPETHTMGHTSCLPGLLYHLREIHFPFTFYRWIFLEHSTGPFFEPAEMRFFASNVHLLNLDQNKTKISLTHVPKNQHIFIIIPTSYVNFCMLRWTMTSAVINQQKPSHPITKHLLVEYK